ncbi:Beta-galactosidase protein [Spatholobus suberectus]|nr:Beta-galactosidase protein [Spatholobus suberectus]
MGRITALLLLCLALISIAIEAVDVSYDGRAITIDGKRRVLISGSIHYPRSTAEMWPSLIEKAKEGGLNVIETYVFWNAHEPQRRQYDFSRNLDLVRFIRTIQNQGLYAMLRIGPYVCAEWNYGGFPVWLHNLPNIEFRTNNAVFEAEMKTFTTLIVNMMKHEKLFASQGGPIILAQIENEYGNIMGSYGQNGKEYVQWCAQLAQSYQIGVPWVMCQQSDAPDPMINTCNGWYCDQFYPNSKNKPKMWTENWTGWFKNWGGPIPHRTAEDVAFAVGRFFQYGGIFQNYYMYHGGTNFGRTSGGPYITTSYDYDAPLDEYGNLNQPKWGHLKRLHELLKSMEKVLTMGSSNNIEYGNMMTATIYSYAGNSVCFLGNANPSKEATINFQNTQYTVPAWSVSILPDCFTEAYNTAKVNAQTSIMVTNNDDSNTLNWQWKPEALYTQTKNGQALGSVAMTTPQLLDQKAVTNDTSDYLWYITSVDIKKGNPILSQDLKLRVKTKGHVLHVFVNGRHVGSQYAQYGKYSFSYEANIKLNVGKNKISLLSGTVGLANYGAYFDNVKVGICGPVQLVGQKDGTEMIKDISKNMWKYKVGIHGENVKLYSPGSNRGWFTNGLPTDKTLLWYKTTFRTPVGTDPVVLDLKGLGKGQAWVNGNNIGRYWPSYLASDNGCSSTCDYRGTYSSNKCTTNCGNPTQRWYHVPRSFLRDGDQNTLVLFEEQGGNPYEVKVATVTVAKACANAYEGHKLELACNDNQVISEIKFVSFGVPEGECGSFKKGHCESSDALSVVKRLCLGKQKCSIHVDEKVLGPTECRVPQNRLAIDAICQTTISNEGKKH